MRRSFFFMDYDDYVREIGRLPLAQQQEVLTLLEELTRTRAKANARTHFLSFVKTLVDGFRRGVAPPHHCGTV